MKPIELFLISVFLTGVILKLLLIPFSDYFIVVSMIILAMLYYPLGIFLYNSVGPNKIFKKSSYRSLSANRILASIGIGLALSIVNIGLLFKLYQLPGFNFILTFGLILSVVALVVLVLKRRYLISIFHKNMIRRVSVCFIIGIIVYVIPEIFFVKAFFRDHPSFIKLYEQKLANPDDEKIQRLVEEARNEL